MNPRRHFARPRNRPGEYRPDEHLPEHRERPARIRKHNQNENCSSAFRFATSLSIRALLVGFLTTALLQIALVQTAAAQKWHGAELPVSPAYYGTLSDDGESIVIVGRFTDTYTTYKVLDEVEYAVKISDGNSTGWVSKIHLKAIHNPRAPERTVHGDSKHPIVSQSVTVVEWNTELKNGMREVRRVQIGDQYVVQAAFGEWYRLKEHGGCWISRYDVVLSSEAVAHFSERLQILPTDVQALKGRGAVYRKSGEFDKAIEDYSRVIELNPESPYGFVDRGLAKSQSEDYDGAIEDYSKAIALDPSYALAYNNRGVAWRNKDEFEKAIEDYDEAIRIAPKYTRAISNRAWLYNHRGRYKEALADYERSLDLEPSDAARCNGVAWMLAVCPDESVRDGDRAVKIAMQACEISVWSFGGYIDTLATAYAETGDFEKAVEYQQKAIEIAKEEHVDEFKSRLELFKQKKAYHDPPFDTELDAEKVSKEE